MTVIKQSIGDLFKNRVFDSNKKHKQEVVLTIRGAIIGTLGSYVLYTGLPKASKSTYLSGAIASAFNTFDIFHAKLTPPKARPQILYVDTEHSDYNYFKQLEKMKALALRNSLPENFIPISCREDEPETIIKLIEYYIGSYKECSVVVIDGLLDLAKNYNDEREGKSIANWLKRITKQYDILVIAIIHVSRSAGAAVGHLGAIVERYCESSLEVIAEQKTKQYVMKPKLLRSAESWNFEPIAINCIEGRWNLVDYIEPEPAIPTKKTNKQ